jgi:hypothetical protein
VEQGGYHELLARKGEFRNLINGGEWDVSGSGESRRESVAVKGLSGVVDWSGQA